MQKYDCHCHIFNILMVGWKAILEQLNEAMLLIKDEDGKLIEKKNITPENQEHFKTKINKLIELIRLFTRNSEKIFNMLDQHYNKEYVLFPLMFDGDFLLDCNDDENLIHLNSLLSEARATKKTSNNDGNLNRIKQIAEISNTEHAVILTFLKKAAVSLNIGNGSKPKKDGFTKQYEQIKKMAQNPEINQRMIPFLGVDPRRKNIKDYLSEVGKGKLFAGIKVYPPNGFSPCDGVLFGPNSIFEFCSKNAIPVVSHCSYGGFATPAMSVEINGFIMTKDAIEPKPFNGIYNFSIGLLDGYNEMVKERADLLNNPLIWEIVLKKYPNLILVLAHFGSENNAWQQKILSLMKIYPNLYTDVSCMSTKDNLQKVVSIFKQNPEIQNKILYGSDYFLDMFFNDSFEEYFQRMQNEFGSKMFNQISSQNPVNYMAKWYAE